MAKKLSFNEDCSNKLFAGVTKLADAVKVTLGPCGRLVAFEKNGDFVSTKDGVTAAGAVMPLEDPEENAGAKLVYGAASKTNTVAGDSTTTSTVLAYSIIKEGLKSIAAGYKPTEIKKGIEIATKDLLKELKAMSKEVSSNDEIKNVATISANNDPEIGNILAEAIEKVGKDGVITVEESKSMDTTVKLTEGLQFDNGYVNNYFVTDRERMTAEYDKSYVLVTDKKISSVQQILNLLNAVGPTSTPLTIICDDMDGDALGTLIVNQLRGSLKSLVVKAPSYGENRKAMLEDIAILTGATFISEEKGLRLEDAKLETLGVAKVKASKNETTITNIKENNKELEARIDEIKKQIDASEDDFVKGKLQQRLAKLTSKVAVVSVGGATEVEMKERKYRIDDTIAATKAALAEGILPGGGVALLEASNNVGNSKADDKLTDGEARGIQLTLEAVKAPFKQIIENAGINSEVILNEVEKEDKSGYGFNAKTGFFGNMMEMGVVDTTKAISAALANAASVAEIILTTSCVITELPKKDEAPLMAQPMGQFNY